MDFGEIAGALVVAAVTGLGFLAVRFPATFEDIRRGLIAAFVLFLVVGITHDFSVLSGSEAMLPFVSEGNKAAAEAARSSLTTPGWLTWSLAGFAFYLIFLDWLSKRLLSEKKKKEGERN